MLLYADDIEMLACDSRERTAVVLGLFYLLILGVPMKMSKFRGGFQLDRIGLHLDYQLYAIGISAARAAWVIKWISELLKSGKTGVRELVGAVGR